MKKVLNLFSEKLEMEMGAELTPLFSQAKIYIMYTGENPNGSKFNKEVVEKSLPTIKNIPIVGEFIYEKENFKGHGGRLVIDDEGIEYQVTTSAIGLIPESAELSWQTVIDEKEIEREYLVVDGALIWNRDEKVINSLKEDNFGQSMEVTITDMDFYDWGKIDVKDFFFNALCILGVDKNGEGYVQPAFKDAKIITYSSTAVTQDFENMKIDFEEAFDKKLIFEGENNTQEEEDTLNKEFTDILTKYGLDEATFAELGLKPIAEFENAEELDKAIEKVYNDVSNNEGAPKDTGKDNPDNENEKTPEEFQAELEALEKTNGELKAEADSYKEKFEAKEKELHNYQINDKIDELANQYEGLEAHVSELRKNDENYTVAQIENKVYELIGRHSLVIASKEDNLDKDSKENFSAKKNKVSVGDDELDENHDKDEPEYYAFFRAKK